MIILSLSWIGVKTPVVHSETTSCTMFNTLFLMNYIMFGMKEVIVTQVDVQKYLGQRNKLVQTPSERDKLLLSPEYQRKDQHMSYTSAAMQEYPQGHWLE